MLSFVWDRRILLVGVTVGGERERGTREPKFNQRKGWIGERHVIWVGYRRAKKEAISRAGMLSCK